MLPLQRACVYCVYCLPDNNGGAIVAIHFDRRQTLIAKRCEMDGEVVYRFDIRIQGDDETVFFDI